MDLGIMMFLRLNLRMNGDGKLEEKNDEYVKSPFSTI